MKIFSKVRGFTLLELMVVIAIIGILSGIIVSGLGEARESGRDAKRIADIKNIQLALSLYYNDNLEYPLGVGSEAFSALVTTGYLPSVPSDPKGASYFYNAYAYDSDGSNSSAVNCQNVNIQASKYHLAAIMETESYFNEDADGLLFADYEICGDQGISPPSDTIIITGVAASADCLNADSDDYCYDVVPN